MMKHNYVTRILSCLLAVSMIVILTACGSADDTKNTQTEERQENSQTAAENSGVDAVSSASYTTINGTLIGRLRRWRGTD